MCDTTKNGIAYLLFSCYMVTMGLFSVQGEATEQAKVIKWTSQYDTRWAASKILSGRVGADDGWASVINPSYPQEILIQLPQGQTLNGLRINPYTVEDKSRWAKALSIMVAEEVDGPATKVGSTVLAQQNHYQSVAIRPTAGRFVKLVIASNWGGNYVELGDVQLDLIGDGGGTDSSMDLVDITAGANVVGWTSQYDNGDWAATNLLSGQTGAGQAWASSQNPKYPQQLVIKLAKPSHVASVAVNPKTSESADRWSKDLNILVSSTSSGPWQGVANTRLQQLDQYQQVDFSPTLASYIMLSVASNWGGIYTEIGDVKLYGNNGWSLPPTDNPTPLPSDPATEPDQSRTIANTRNIATVQNGPTEFATFTLTKTTVITEINTYHWNNGKGTPSPGKIGIQQQGSWQAIGKPGMYDTQNAEWFVYPNITLGPGTYIITDSSAETWSQNAGSKGIGHFVVRGK